MSLIYILVSKECETQKTIYCMISFTWVHKHGQISDTKIRVIVTIDELIDKGQKGTFWDTGNVLCLHMDDVDGDYVDASVRQQKT